MGAATAGNIGKTLSKQAAQFSREIAKSSKDATYKSAFVVTDNVAANLGGRSITMRGVGRHGAKVGVGFDIKGNENPTALVRMRGPAQLLERGTKPHTIMARGIGRPGKRERGVARGEWNRRRYEAKAQLYQILFAGASGGRLKQPNTDSGWRVGPFNHPGMRGKFPFARGVEMSRPLTGEVWRRSVRQALRRSFINGG